VHGLALYRANMPRRPGQRRVRRTELPVQVVVPARDRYVGPDLLADLERWAPRLTRRDLDAGHWVPRSHPDLLARWVTELGDQHGNCH
jgi:pimeloyl-ACP methyl ester carboxylesterase